MSELYSAWHFIRRQKTWMLLLFFFILILFVDDDSFWHRRANWQLQNRLQSEIALYKRQYVNDSTELKHLETDPHAVEKVAYEKYYMSHPNEDVFIIDDGSYPISQVPESPQIIVSDEKTE